MCACVYRQSMWIERSYRFKAGHQVDEWSAVWCDWWRTDRWTLDEMKGWRGIGTQTLTHARSSAHTLKDKAHDCEACDVRVGITRLRLLEGTRKLTEPKTHYAKTHTGTRTHTSGEDKGTFRDEMLSLSQWKRDMNNTQEAVLPYACSQTHT